VEQKYNVHVQINFVCMIEIMKYPLWIFTRIWLGFKCVTSFTHSRFEGLGPMYVISKD
jgi:hypothetical protein